MYTKKLKIFRESGASTVEYLCAAVFVSFVFIASGEDLGLSMERVFLEAAAPTCDADAGLPEFGTGMGNRSMFSGDLDDDGTHRAEITNIDGFYQTCLQNASELVTTVNAP